MTIPSGGAHIAGDLNLPPASKGVVLFAHGSGSSRHSSRNTFVADFLNRRGFATLLVDLLTAEEEELDRDTRHLRFDIALLIERLTSATDWLEQDPDTRGMPIGYFGASTGAAAALGASVHNPASVKAVVSRGGRPDLAWDSLHEVCAPTLLVVGSRDDKVLELNKGVLGKLLCDKDLYIVPGATHLFEEPGALETVSAQAADWFAKYLGPA